MNNFELPSIVVDGGVLKPKRLDKNEFRSSIPVTYSNTSVDLFGVKENGTELDEDLDDLFSRASLRTPREIKERNKRGKHVNSRYDSKPNSGGYMNDVIGIGEDSMSTMTGLDGRVDADSSIYTVISSNSRYGSPLKDGPSSTGGTPQQMLPVDTDISKNDDLSVSLKIRETVLGLNAEGTATDDQAATSSLATNIKHTPSSGDESHKMSDKELEERRLQSRGRILDKKIASAATFAHQGRKHRLAALYLIPDEERAHDTPSRGSKRNKMKSTKHKFKNAARMAIQLSRLKVAAAETAAEKAKKLNEMQEVQELNANRDKYMGEDAKHNFNVVLRRCVKNSYIYDTDEGITESQNTPRSRYLREIVKQNVLPLALVLRNESNPHSLNFAHKGLGDEKALSLMHIIDSLPAVATINLCDNRLTDDSLSVLTHKLKNLKMLTHLDLSYNDIDESSKDIESFLGHEACTLKVLKLDGADVDDIECSHMMKALETNKVLTTLSISHNHIGEMELLNTVMPDLITGGEAIGEMLTINDTLVELDLSWNSIRGDSAITLAESLEHNKTLLRLYLGHNAFGDMGTQMLGHALRHNTTLRELDLSYNSTVPRSAATLAHSLVYNKTLQQLNISGNLLGSVGAQGIVGALQRTDRGENGDSTSSHLDINFKSCDTKRVDSSIFDPKSPSGVWIVDLEEPYGVMVVEECFYLANNKAGCVLKKLEYKGRKVDLQMIEENDVDETGNKMHRFSAEEFLVKAKELEKLFLAGNSPSLLKQTEKGLNELLKAFSFKISPQMLSSVTLLINQNWAAKVALAEERMTIDELPALSDVLLYEFFFALFQVADDDKSGLVTIDELIQIMHDLGVPVDVYKAKRIMRDYDVDDSGTIDADEFGMAMVKEFCNLDPPKKKCVLRSTGEPWEIPNTGKVTITMVYECDEPSSRDVPGDDSVDLLIVSLQNARTHDERDSIFNNICRSPYYFLTTEHAQLVFDEIRKTTEDFLAVVPSILCQMVSPQHARRFIDSNFTDLGKLALRVRIGPIYNAYLGNTTGHYTFNLKLIDDRTAGQRLAAIASNQEKYAKSMGVHTSQKGDQSSFRNEMLENVGSLATPPSWWGSCPSAGKLSCDFTSMFRPPEGSTPISDSRFSAIINKFNLKDILPLKERLDSYHEAAVEKRLKKQAADALKRQRLRELRKREAEMRRKDTRQAAVVSEDASVEDLLAAAEKQKQLEEEERQARLQEIAEARAEEDGENDESESDNEEEEALIRESKLPIVLNLTKVKEYYFSYIENCHQYCQFYPKERMRDVSRPGYSNTSRPTTPTDMQLDLPKHSKTHPHAIFAFAYWKLLELQVTLPSIYLSVSQVLQLMHLFPSDDFLRVQVLVACFSRIIDIKNIHRVVYDPFVFSDDERMEAEHRLGVLNLFNPSYVDREFRLDLRRWDHREVVKYLIRLSMAEPGENWEDACYRWAKYDLPVPGWVLPAPWTLPDNANDGDGGPRKHGWLCVKYTSTGVGCKPNIAARQKMTKEVLAGLKRLV